MEAHRRRRRCRDVGEYRSVVMEGRRMKEELDTVKEDQAGETRSSCLGSSSSRSIRTWS